MSEQDSGNERPGQTDPEITEEEMAARLDEAIEQLSRSEEGDPQADDSSGDVEVLVQEEAPEPAPLVGDAILTAADAHRAAVDPEDIDTPDPAAEEQGEEAQRWTPVGDGDQDDMELRPTEQPKTEQDLWGATEEPDDGDMELADVEERPEEPWGPLPREVPMEPGRSFEPAAHPPPLLVAGPDRPRRRPPAESLPWRGTVRVVEPRLPDLLFVVDVQAERSRLLVAAWDWDEQEPGNRLLRLRLADDGPGLSVPAAAPNEAAIEARLALGSGIVPVRLSLCVERGARGIRLGRDALAGRFQVDAGADEWARED